MVDNVESGTQVEQAKQSYLLTIGSVDDVRDDIYQRCISRVPCRYADWSGGIEFESTRCFFICSATIRSITFEMNVKFEIG